jgi:hypothetical protein
MDLNSIKKGMKKKLRIIRIWLHGKYWLIAVVRKRRKREFIQGLRLLAPVQLPSAFMNKYGNESFLEYSKTINKPAKP